MTNKLYWGLGVLIILFIAVSSFVFYQQWTELQQMKKEAAEDDKQREDHLSKPDEPIVSSDKPITKDDLPAADEGFKWVQHDDHFHQVPIDAPDTWQGGEHAPNMPVNQPVVLSENDISKLPELADDIDPDDIPPFSLTMDDGKVYHYDRPLTPEERDMYDKLKSLHAHKDVSPAKLKVEAIAYIRHEKLKAGYLQSIWGKVGAGSITRNEAEKQIDDFFERSR